MESAVSSAVHCGRRLMRGARGGQKSPQSDQIRKSQVGVTVSLTVTCLSYFTPCDMYFFMFYSFQVSGPKGNSIRIYWLCCVFVVALSFSG